MGREIDFFTPVRAHIFILPGLPPPQLCNQPCTELISDRLDLESKSDSPKALGFSYV